MQLMTYLDPEFLIKTFGLIGIFFIIFAESGLFFGFFLPGDSLLFTAGFLAPLLGINIFILLLIIIVAAVLGDSFGYWFGNKVGHAFFRRDDSIIFKKKYMDQAKIFFEKHGPKSIVFARFVPIVRTFIPILAGIGEMKYTKFLTFNIIGGSIWASFFTLLGYFIGRLIPGVDKYITIIILAIIILSFIPAIREYKKIK